MMVLIACPMRSAAASASLADRVYLCRVIGGVHEIVEGRDPRSLWPGLARESWTEAEVRMARDPAVCRVDREPRRVSRIPWAFFVPRALGRSASMASRPSAWRSRRGLRSLLDLSSSLRGPFGVSVFFGFATSRPSMAVESRDTGPMSVLRLDHQRLMHPPGEPPQTPAKSSLGISPRPAAQPPQRRVRAPSLSILSTRCRVVGRSHTARNARAVLWRMTCFPGAPTKPSTKIKPCHETTMRSEQRTHSAGNSSP